MLRAAIADPDPCVIIESRALYQSKGMVNLDAPVSPIGGARVRIEGKDVLLTGWGSVIPKMIDAASILQKQGIQATVLDLRWLAPLDEEAIHKALERNSMRIVVVHEACLTGGFGGEIITRLLEQSKYSPIQFRRVTGMDSRMPASPILQGAIVPDTARIVEAAVELVNQVM